MSLTSDEVVVSNTVLVDGSGVTQPVSGPLTDAQLRATPVAVSMGQGANAAVTQLALTGGVSTTLLAANANRTAVILFTPSQPVYIKFGATASTTSFTYKITANNSTLEIKGYTGRIDIMSQNGQTVTVTEVTL